LPLNVGIGVDSGEAVRIDGGFRGAALNIAARLCGLAHAGEVIVTDSVVHLAGRLEGIRYVDRGRVHLKGISQPVHILELRRKLSPSQRLMSYAEGRAWSCHNAMNSAPGALASIVCSTDVPNRLQLTLFRSKRELEKAYNKGLERAAVPHGGGSCRADSWRGEVEWFHGVGEPGGRAFCYLSLASQRSY